MRRSSSASPVRSMPARESRRPLRAGRPWQLVVAELAANAGRGCLGATEPRCPCPLCSGPLD